MSPSGLRLEGPETPVNLNADQLRAVEHPGGPLLVLAGPGTGKTGVLVARIAHLVANRGVRPDRILALTFSRRAADEMSEWVRSRVPEAAFVETRTFHSFALSIVRRYASALGLRMAPEIMATGEQWALVSELLADESSEVRPGAPGSGAPRLRFAELLSPDPANMDRGVGGTPSIEAGEREVIALVLGTGATAVMDDRRAHSSGRRTSGFTGKSSS